MAGWTPFPYAGEYDYSTEDVRRLWSRLHAGDAQTLPPQPELLQAWTLFHRGEFQRAWDAGLAAGGAGLTIANKAACIHATYLERSERARLDLLLDVARRAEAQAAREPRNAAAWHLQGYALGRYSQAISVAKALAQGLGGKVKEAFEKAIRLDPRHADAHVALGTFHAEVIDKVGALIGGMTYGAKKETGLALFRQALALNPDSAITLVEYANGLVMLEGESKLAEATALYERAAAITPLDAAQRLDVELARAELQE